MFKNKTGRRIPTERLKGTLKIHLEDWCAPGFSESDNLSSFPRMRIHRFLLQDSQLSLHPGQGIKASLSDNYISVGGNWKVDKSFMWVVLALDCLLTLGKGISSPGLPWWLSGKESACQVGDAGLIPGLGKSPGETNGNPLQYSCPRDRGALPGSMWLQKSQTQLRDCIT